MSEPIKIIPGRVQKNSVALVYFNTFLPPLDKDRLAEEYTAKLGCKAVILDVGMRVCFVHNNSPEILIDTIDKCGLSDMVKNALREWLTYKRYKYEYIGLKKLLTTTARYVVNHGEAAVCDLISESMGQMWKGICWAYLKPRKAGEEKWGTVVAQEGNPNFVSRNITDAQCDAIAPRLRDDEL